MKPLAPSIEKKIQNLARRLGEFREESGTKRFPPRKVWDEAITLCALAPLSLVAEGLGVSSNGLRNHVKRANRIKTKASSQSRFLEITNVPASIPIPSSVAARPVHPWSEFSRGVELTRCDGSLLRIADLKAHELDLRTLIQGFMTSAVSSPGGTRR